MEIIVKLGVHTTKPLACSPHFLFRRDQNHCFSLTPKLMMMCEQDIKDSAPKLFKFSAKFRNNSRLR